MKVAEFAIPGSEWLEEIEERRERIHRYSLLPGERDLPQHLVNDHGLFYDRGDPEWDTQYYAHLRELRKGAAGVEEITYHCFGGGGHYEKVQWKNLYGTDTPSYSCPTHGLHTKPITPGSLLIT